MPSALPPATLEGWYALHQVFAATWPALRALPPGRRADLAGAAQRVFTEIAQEAGEGWTQAVRLVGGGADWMLVHLRPTLEELAAVQQRVKSSPLADVMRLEYDYLSVTEAGLYHATAEAARAGSRGARSSAAASTRRPPRSSPRRTCAPACIRSPPRGCPTSPSTP
ncbi:MAG TPA: chlorite dismutase family protein [Longimicrobiaceae bacterium]|nr:chlorite dismutase family protein [Longimicrobiaceae bacterium]